MGTHKVNFCIVGGGPAGLTLALLLLRSGASVAVVERSKSLDREYRGEILQPGAMALLDELGVLGSARERGGYPLRRFQLVEHGRVAMDIDYEILPEPYRFLLSIPQRNVLEELLTACLTYDSFTFLSGCSIRSLVTDEGQVNGVVCAGGSERHRVDAHAVVAADGRYSKTRHLAGINYTRLDMFHHDIVWFRIEHPTREAREVAVYRAAGNPLLIYDSYPDRLQIGWTLPHNGYSMVADRGIEFIQDQVIRAAPQFADQVRESLRSRADLSLLDVFSGYADEWAVDGLVLAGDSAHTHSPIGAQGINLAVQDAALLHPVLMRSLRSGDASRAALSTWVPDRRRDIDRVIALQGRQSRALLGGDSNNRVQKAIRPLVARALAHTPVYRKILNQIAFGSRPITIDRSLFREPESA
jgi:monooxygenase